MTPPESFPLITTMAQRRAGCPTAVPWSAVEPHRGQAFRNHGQTLEQLAGRGGLEPEAIALAKRLNAGGASAV